MTTTSAEAFRLNLRRLMERRSISFRALADVAGVSFVHLSNIANGKAVPGLDVVDKVATALRVQPWRMLVVPKVNKEG